MKKVILSLITITFFSVLLVGCGEPYTEGIVIKVDSNTVLVAGNLSLDRYEEIKDDLSSDADMFEAMKQEVRDTGGDIRLIDLIYDNTEEFEVGDHVNAWLKGGVNESSPAKAKAKKITLKE